MEPKRDGKWQTISMSVEEADEHCKFGTGGTCCVFLVMASTGFECAKKDSISVELQKRLDSGTTNAKGYGNWESCFWYTKNVVH